MNNGFSSLCAGQSVDIAPFAHVVYWTGATAAQIESHPVDALNGVWQAAFQQEQGGWHLGLLWDRPRQVTKFVVKFVENAPPKVRLQYQHHNWPSKFRGGWTAVDDPYNGEWVTIHGEYSVDENLLTVVFDPLDFSELPGAVDFAVDYRQSHRFRLLFKDDSYPAIEDIQAFSTSVWATTTINVECTEIESLDIRNGYLESVQVTSGGAKAVIWYCDTSAQVDAKLLPVPPDQTVVTINRQSGSFSFAVEDAVRDVLDIPEFNAVITTPTSQPVVGLLEKPVIKLIEEQPDQTWQRARTEIPELVKTHQNRYVPLGAYGNRQEFALRYNGHLFMDKGSLKISGRDTARALWPGASIEYRFPTMDPPDYREREDAVSQEPLEGSLPIYTSIWRDRGIRFQKTDFAAFLFESSVDHQNKRGDEALAVFSRITLENVTEAPVEAVFWVEIDAPEVLEVNDGVVKATARLQEEYFPYHQAGSKTHWTPAPYKQPRLRLTFDLQGKGCLTAASLASDKRLINSHCNAVKYAVMLNPHERHSIELTIPFNTYTQEPEITLIKSLKYEDKLAEMKIFWRGLIEESSRITTPMPLVNEFIDANVCHIAITADKDVSTGYYLLPAATYGYNVCANEAMHQVRSLDFRGCHADARQYLMPFVHCQSSRPLHGKFKTQEGVLHGLRLDPDEETDYQTFNYNLDHGFVLFALAEHYLLTRDRDWLASIADNLIKACDFVTRERSCTKKTNADGSQVSEYGLIPPGHLEDNPEWLYWYAVNAYCYRGMQAAAYALADISHPQADRLNKDADGYRRDIRRSVQRNTELSPVVRLQDGGYQTFTPTRAGLFSRDLGWIRDSLYGPIHMLECGVVDPLEDLATRILTDSEDNVFIHQYRGRTVDIPRNWFSHGGNTIQSGLLPMPMVYLKRGQPKHAVRSLLNAFAQNIYADVRCFTEHPVEAFGLGAGPFYKTPDESCWVNWLRCALVFEDTFETLQLLAGIPEEWAHSEKSLSYQQLPTYFGQTSLSAKFGDNSAVYTLILPDRNRSSGIYLHLRHLESRGIQSVTINSSAATPDPSLRLDLTAFAGDEVQVEVTLKV